MDDEQGPWWTRPPEPGPPAPPVQRRRPSDGQHDVDEENPPTGSGMAGVTALYPQADRTPSAHAPSEYTGPRLVTPLPEPEPEPEPEPATRPPKPVVRRVAVAPAPPPVRTTGHGPRDEQTETLPPLNDGIFATFSGPPPPSAPPSTRGSSSRQRATDHAATRNGPLDRTGSDRHLGAAALLAQVKQVNLPEPRVLLLAAAAALVALLIVIVALVSGRGTSSTQAADTPTAAPAPVAGQSVLKGKSPDGLKQLSALDAAAQLRKAGQNPGGAIVEAWNWDDKNGRNLVVTSIAPARTNKRTLRVVHIAGLDGDDIRTLRVMKDPDLPANCNTAGTAEFTPKALIVVDLNGDNIAEVVTGWTSRCGDATTDSQIRLALITNGDKYILRGEGVLGQAGTGTFTPAPRSARWPTNYLKMLAAHYRKLYN